MGGSALESPSPGGQDSLGAILNQNALSQGVQHTKVVGGKALVLGDLAHCLGGSVFRKMMDLGGIALTANFEEDYCLAIKWAPWSLYEIPANVRSHLRVKPINDTRFKCSKSRLGIWFEEVFGYPLLLEPKAFEGICVAKSERNAMHDGRLVHCPTAEVVPGLVYQRLVENSVNAEYVEDIRVPVIGRRIPFVYLKYRLLKNRFSNENLYARMSASDRVLKPEELRLLHSFVRHIGLQYGELDVLRDNVDGRLYIVDANNTPYGPPNHLEPAEVQAALELMTRAFLEEFAGK